jgi:hypothetical protein
MVRSACSWTRARGEHAVLPRLRPCVGQGALADWRAAERVM